MEYGKLAQDKLQYIPLRLLFKLQRMGYTEEATVKADLDSGKLDEVLYDFELRDLRNAMNMND